MNFNSILDVPFFLTNAIPINLSGVIKSQDRIIIKKFRNIKTNKFLKLRKFSKNLHQVQNLMH